jgi:hypothetical protein
MMSNIRLRRAITIKNGEPSAFLLEVLQILGSFLCFWLVSSRCCKSLRHTPPHIYVHNRGLDSIGYPVITFYDPDYLPKLRGNTNATGQVPQIIGNFGLIDQDTPKSAYTIASRADGHTPLQLIFSDEFNKDGRSFYPGDDPYWEAVDLHYWVS